MGAQENRARLVRCFTLVAEGDLQGGFEALTALHAPDYVVHESPLTPFAGDYYGLDDYVANAYPRILQHMDPTGIDMRQTMAEGDYVSLFYSAPWRATPESDPVTVLISEWFRFEGDQIAEVWPFFFDAPTGP